MINEGDDPVVTTTDSPFYRAPRPGGSALSDAILTPMLVPYTTDPNGFRPPAPGETTPVIVPAAAMASIGDAEFVPQDALGPAIQIIFDAIKATAGR